MGLLDGAGLGVLLAAVGCIAGLHATVSTISAAGQPFMA
jgi:hypothetical protein